MISVEDKINQVIDILNSYGRELGDAGRGIVMDLMYGIKYDVENCISTKKTFLIKKIKIPYGMTSSIPFIKALRIATNWGLKDAEYFHNLVRDVKPAEVKIDDEIKAINFKNFLNSEGIEYELY